MKKINRLWLALLLTVLVAALLAVGFTAAAGEETPEVVDSGYCGGEGDGTNLTWVLTDDGTLTISGTGAMADCSRTSPWHEWRSGMQSVVLDCGVTSIGNGAFNTCLSLKAVTIPDGVTFIGNEAFGSTMLESVTIPNSVTEMGEDLFEGCTSLKTATIGGSVTQLLGTFMGCTSLESVTLPDSLTSISGVFTSCTSLKTVMLPGSLSSIGDAVFYGCTALQDVFYPGSEAQWNAVSVSVTGNEPLQNATIHFNVADWGYCGGEGDGTNLMWVLTNDGTLTISGEGAMADYDPNDNAVVWRPYRSSVQKIEIKNGVTTITDFAFAQCSNLKKALMPKSLTVIGENAFMGCNQLEKISIPGSVRVIGVEAFRGCSALQSVYINVGVEEIRTCAFDTFSNALKDVLYTGTEEQWNAITIEDGNTPLTNARLHFNVGIWGYCGAEGDGTNLVWTLDNTRWGTLTISGEGPMADGCPTHLIYENIHTIIIEDGVTTIGIGAFAVGASCVNSVTIPSSVTLIGEGAFADFMCLSSIEIPEGVTTIGAYAFSGANLQNVTLPDSVIYIGEGAFSDTPWYRAICQNHPDGMIYLGKVAYRYKGAMEEHAHVVLNEDCKAIAQYAFSVDGMESITIPAGVKYIGQDAFGPCSSLKNVFYAGSEEQWNQIDINTDGSNYAVDVGNAYLLNANIHYNATGHTPGETVIENEVPATCTAAGSYDEVVYCTQCPCECSRTHVTVDPINHKNAQTLPAAEATATEHGHTAGVWCPDCETWLSGGDVIHNKLGAQTVIKEPTATEDGLVDIVCTVCGEHSQYTVSATGPQPGDNGGDDGGIWKQITSFFKGFIDWFLRLFRWIG